MKRFSVDSRVIRSAGYNPASMTLEIEFTSREVYQYLRVPRSKYKAFMTAGSKGAFFNAYIRDRYPTGKLEFSSQRRHGSVRIIRKPMLPGSRS